MRAVNAILVGVFLVAPGFGAKAQTLRSTSGPAEIPPASYSQPYYVDSRGCAYIRAGYGGTVTWVPRVMRSGRLVCNRTPSVQAAIGRPATGKRQPTAAQGVKSVTPAKPAASRVAASKPGGATWPRIAPAAPVATVKPATVTKPAVRVAVAPKTTFKTPQQHSTHGIYAIRTGPQPIHPGDYVNGRLGGGTVAAMASDKVLKVEVTRLSPPPVPKGYKSLLAEDKINPRYGVGSATGKAQMDLVWTETMPRRLIDVTTGRDVTTVYATIRYPYTSTTRSSRSYATASAAGTVENRKQGRSHLGRDAASPRNMTAIEDVSATVTAVTPVKPANKSQAVPQSFVQVATFGNPASALQTARRFAAAGIPAGTQAVRRKGKQYRVVLLGPFSDTRRLQAALNAARRAGFGDAFSTR